VKFQRCKATRSKLKKSHCAKRKSKNPLKLTSSPLRSLKKSKELILTLNLLSSPCTSLRTAEENGEISVAINNLLMANGAVVVAVLTVDIEETGLKLATISISTKAKTSKNVSSRIVKTNMKKNPGTVQSLLASCQPINSNREVAGITAAATTTQEATVAVVERKTANLFSLEIAATGVGSTSRKDVKAMILRSFKIQNLTEVEAVGIIKSTKMTTVSSLIVLREKTTEEVGGAEAVTVARVVRQKGSRLPIRSLKKLAHAETTNLMSEQISPCFNLNKL